MALGHLHDIGVGQHENADHDGHKRDDFDGSGDGPRPDGLPKGHRADEDTHDRVGGRKRRQRGIQRAGLEGALGQDHTQDACTQEEVGLPALEQRLKPPKTAGAHSSLSERRTPRTRRRRPCRRPSLSTSGCSRPERYEHGRHGAASAEERRPDQRLDLGVPASRDGLPRGTQPSPPVVRQRPAPVPAVEAVAR